jgi:septal ring factor EnvC (AmiA/AmiB activator)
MYLLRRKHALIGREIAELQEADAARKRRKALRNAEIQAQNNSELEQHATEDFQRPDNVIWLSSGSEVS